MSAFFDLLARMGNGQVLKRSGKTLVGVDPSALTPAGNFVPATDNAYDLGESTTPKRWRRAILSGYVVVPTIGPAAAQQHTLPAVTSDTIALLAAAQTLTNKTLTSPSFGNGASVETGTAQTTDGTVTNVWTKALADNTVYELEVTLVGRRTDSAGRAVYRRRVVVYVEGGTVTVGSPDTIGTDVESTGGYDITIDNSTTTLRVRATGANGHTIRWNATVRLHSAGT